MGLSQELAGEVKTIFREQWTTREGNKIPESGDLKLSNDAVLLDGTVLYSDITESTKLVDTHTPNFAAEVYKAFLHCAAKIVRVEGGDITAYDGDRIMAVFIGDSKNTSAARTALKINYAVVHIINPALKAQYPNKSFTLSHVTGVDTGKLFVARTGVRGANDLVWVGRAANHAAKMSTFSPDFPSRITAEVYDRLAAGAKESDGRAMWERATWNETGRTIYRSNWWWEL